MFAIKEVLFHICASISGEFPCDKMLYKKRKVSPTVIPFWLYAFQKLYLQIEKYEEKEWKVVFVNGSLASVGKPEK